MRTRIPLLLAVVALLVSVVGPVGASEVPEVGLQPDLNTLNANQDVICHPNAPEVCWKEGPVISNQGKKLYFQLLEDYSIDIEAYLLERDLLPGRFSTTAWQDRMLGRLGAISVPPCSGAGCVALGYPAGWDYLALEDGVLTIRKGYRWDGPSTPRHIKKMHNMRASLVHDALYDLMRARIIEPQTGTTRSTGGLNRLFADVMFYRLAWEDGATQAAAGASFDVIRLGGGPRTRKQLTEFPWKWHAVAMAGADITIPGCLPQLVQLDGSASRWSADWHWSEGQEDLADGVSPQVWFEPGEHVVTLVVDDPAQTFPFNYAPEHFEDQEDLIVTIGVPGMIMGTPGDDLLVGTPGDDVIVGLGGNDIIKGGGGNDTICGGPGDDKLLGQAGNDILFGEAGDDSLRGGGGADVLVGGSDDDRLDGGPGKDTVSYASADNRIVANLSTGIGIGEGTDTLIGVEHLIGSGKRDRLTGDDNANDIWGGKGNDVVIGQGGRDKLFGQVGADRLFGKGGRDKLVGGNGVDYLNGGPGTDRCLTGETLVSCE